MRALQIAGFTFSILLLGLMFTVSELFDHLFFLVLSSTYCQLYTRSHEACFCLHHLIVWLEGDNPPAVTMTYEMELETVDFVRLKSDQLCNVPRTVWATVNAR